MSSQAHHIRLLAVALAAGPMTDSAALVARVAPLVGDLRLARWLPSLAQKLVREFGAAARPTWRAVADRIVAHPPFHKAWAEGRGRVVPGVIPPTMAPAEGAPRGWVIPEMTTLDDLSRVLGLHLDDLGWLISRGRAEHYRHRWQAKRSGGWRLLEMPKALLKHAQRQLLGRVLHAIPPHEAAMGFRKGVSVRDFAAPHVGKASVIRLDLVDFFPSISDARIVRIFLTAGYPEPVARALARLTTHAVPMAVLEEKMLTREAKRRWAGLHLPQGAPTSPTLANLAAFRLDCRLTRLAEAAGADYTRYADDLLFSGDVGFARGAERFMATVGGILIEEGFQANHRKTRVMRRAQRQHAAGMVLNERLNACRGDYDRLKAILTNCVRHGPGSQNRDGHPDFAAHLMGRLSWIAFLNPDRGAKLRAIYDRIDWWDSGLPGGDFVARG